ncbi:hypothetical protein [Sphingobium bisphenolivorans]|uniref:hypothetical protein n=1 Tax=Sphingobium bisphenolivorans TaxID=1335760 RepID=UPI0009DBF1B9|nr:hypothetical protein [Sphingobium bisphenolivorans]
MRTTAFNDAGKEFRLAYIPLYRDDEANHCAGCGRQQWIIGRMTAECGFCGTALPLEKFSTWSTSPRIECRGSQADELPEYLRPVS